MKTILTYKIALLCLLLLPTLLWGQVIKGRVTDAVTGSPLQNVNVYLDGTIMGTTTDSQGNFTLNNTLKTSAPLLVSYVGYQQQKINDYADKSLAIALKRKVIALKEVTVSTDKINRASAMRIFLREFIGRNNQDCDIINPDDIYFYYNKKEALITAYADKPLIIANKKLGYKVTYFLSDFNCKPYHTSYRGNYFFAEDTVGLQPSKIKKIIAARDEAYKGSRMHFIRALWANQLSKNGFAMYKAYKGPIDYISPYRLEAANRISYNHIVQVEEGRKFIMLQKSLSSTDAKFDSNEIYVTYQQVYPAYLRQTDSSKGTIIESTGYHDNGLEWKEYFGKWRVGELLPFEFQPSADLE